MSDAPIDPEVIVADGLFPTKKKAGRKKGSTQVRGSDKLPLVKVNTILEMHAKGVPGTIIAQAAGVHRNTVSKVLKRFEGTFRELKNVNDYRGVKAQLFDATELQLLKSMNDPSKLRKATLNGVAFAFDKIHNAGRLERGLSTQNISSKVTQFTNVDTSKVKPDPD